MAALTPTTVITLDTRVDKSYGTNVEGIRFVYVAATTTATSNTTDLNSYVNGDIDGILMEVAASLDGATAATANTWSSTTITWAGHAGSGGMKGLYLVY